MAEIKKETEFNIGLQKCDKCDTSRFFYRRKDALKDDPWFCQLCGFEVPRVIHFNEASVK